MDEQEQLTSSKCATKCESINVIDLNEAVIEACFNILQVHGYDFKTGISSQFRNIDFLLDLVAQVTNGGQGLLFILDLDGVVTQGHLQELQRLYLDELSLITYTLLRHKLPMALITIYTDRAKVHTWDKGAWIRKGMGAIDAQKVVDLQDYTSYPLDSLPQQLKDQKSVFVVGGTKRRSIQIITAFTYRTLVRTFLLKKGPDNGNRFGNFDRTISTAIKALDEVTPENTQKIVCIIDDYHKLGKALEKYSGENGKTVMHFIPHSRLFPTELPKYAIPRHLALVILRMFVQVMEIRRQLAREKRQGGLQ